MFPHIMAKWLSLDYSSLNKIILYTHTHTHTHRHTHITHIQLPLYRFSVRARISSYLSVENPESNDRVRPGHHEYAAYVEDLIPSPYRHLIESSHTCTDMREMGWLAALTWGSVQTFCIPDVTYLGVLNWCRVIFTIFNVFSDTYYYCCPKLLFGCR